MKDCRGGQTIQRKGPGSASLTSVSDFDHTRASLLVRLRQSEDGAAWREFFDTYWPLLMAVGRKSGLREADAQDVAQDVLKAVAQQMPDFRYDPGRGSFKAWLLTLTRRRVARHWRETWRTRNLHQELPATPAGDTAIFERIPDNRADPLDAVWEAEWEHHILECALRRIRSRVSSRQLQIYTLAAVQRVPVRTICKALGVGAPQVYLIKHRVGGLVKAEVRRLRDRLDHPGHAGPGRGPPGDGSKAQQSNRLWME